MEVTLQQHKERVLYMWGEKELNKVEIEHNV